MRRARNIFLILSVACALQAQAAVELGIDVLEDNGYALLQGKRLGLITNQTGVDSRGVRTRVLLKKHTDRPAVVVAGWADDVVRFRAERSQ